MEMEKNKTEFGKKNKTDFIGPYIWEGNMHQVHFIFQVIEFIKKIVNRTLQHFTEFVNLLSISKISQSLQFSAKGLRIYLLQVNKTFVY